MDTFLLLTLPPDTLHKLLYRFEVIELFQLSQCSRKASNTVKTYSSSFDETPFDIVIKKSTTKHEMYIRRTDHFSTIDFTFYGERNPERCYLRFPKTYDFDGQLIDFCKQENNDRRSRFGCSTPHSTADFFKFAHYIKTLFNAILFELHLTIDDDSLKVTLLSEWLLKSQYVLIRGSRVTHEEMVQLLEYFDGVKYWELDCTLGHNFSYDKTISTNILWVKSATWIKRHNLLKFNCTTVEIKDSRLENEDLNAFISHWLQSEDKKLESMRIYREHSPAFSVESDSEEEKENAYKFVQEEVLKGLPTLPGAPKRQDAIRALRNIPTHTPFEAGMDLRRESDGVLATVVVREEGYYGVSFTFVVWQEPNPNVVVLVP